MLNKIAFSIVTLFSVVAMYAQVPCVHTIDDTYTAEQLAKIIGVSCPQKISNITASGGFSSSGGPSYGYLTADVMAEPTFPFAKGVLLATGYAASSVLPYTIIDQPFSEGDASWAGDADLEAALGTTNTYNATTLEFDFIPQNDNISIKYFMASEEFSEVGNARYCNNYDGVAILIKPAGTSQPYQNIAVLPNTTNPVSIHTVNYGWFCNNNADFPSYISGLSLTSTFLHYYNVSMQLTAAAPVVPGTQYHIKFVVADQGDTLNDTAMYIGGNDDYGIDLGLPMLLSNFTPLCAGDTTTLTSMPGANAYKWYKDDVLLPAETTQQYTVTNTGTYTSEALFTGNCTYSSDIRIEYAAQISQNVIDFNQCDDDFDGLTAYNIEEIAHAINNPDVIVLYYYATAADAAANINHLPVGSFINPMPFYNTVPNQVIYARVQNQFGCQVIIPVRLGIPPPTSIVLPPISGCQAENGPDGFAEFNLSQATAILLPSLPADASLHYFSTYAAALAYGPALPDLYTNSTAGGETIYVRINTTQGCYGIVPLQLVVHPFGFGTTFTDESIALCNQEPETLAVDGGYASYTWNTVPEQYTPSIIASQPGTYTVTVINSLGCERSKTFTVSNSGPPNGVRYDTRDFAGGKNSLSITAQGTGNYEYSLDGITYQPSPEFHDLSAGKYTIYVRDANGCLPIFTDVVYILDYPLAFTPNGDTFNDKWYIPYLFTRPGAAVTIFDRYGKLITALMHDDSGWDGTLKGSPLPADDYWFVVNLEPGKIVKGHFALIR